MKIETKEQVTGIRLELNVSETRYLKALLSRARINIADPLVAKYNFAERLLGELNRLDMPLNRETCYWESGEE